MRIPDLYAGGGRPVFSLEFFTPKDEAGRRALFRAIERLQVIHPGFVSITCGAAGTTRERTADLAIEIQEKFGLTAMAHLVCTGTTQSELEQTLLHMQTHGIENILALRGDPPKGVSDWKPVEGGFRYANELVGFVRERFSLGIGGACYPEKHHQAPNLATDIRNLKRKVDAGAEFLITQLFFDNDKYWRFVRMVRAEGIDVPIVPGIMPVQSWANLQRIASLSPGTSIPATLERAFQDAAEDEEAALRAGVSFAAEQCRELLAEGAPGIHFYTLNRSKPTLETFRQLRGPRETSA
jgi:methylenetetrahydrofolate reductase (NADPH)